MYDEDNRLDITKLQNRLIRMKYLDKLLGSR